jgi:succinate dehydrogenase/fumarate reductase flavoprotein subunit
MWDRVGVVREGGRLQAALGELGRLRGVTREEVRVFSEVDRFNYDWVEAVEVSFMADVGEMMAAAALMRTESRGAHHRADHPQTDNQGWLKETVVRDDGGTLRLSTQPVRLTEISPPPLDATH